MNVFYCLLYMYNEQIFYKCPNLYLVNFDKLKIIKNKIQIRGN